FLKAEDGIRYWSVTGVQTCALPICGLQGEFVTRLLARDPNPEGQLPRALGHVALLPSSIVGSAVEAMAGRPAGDAAQYVTNLALPMALGFGYAPKTAAALVGGGTMLDLGRHLLRTLGR